MPKLRILQSLWWVGDDGVAQNFNPDAEPLSIELSASSKYSGSWSVAASGSQVIYSTALGHPATFDVIAIWTDSEDVVLEMATDIGGQVGDEFYTIKLRANLWFLIPKQASYANYTPAFAGGTLDLLEKLTVKNLGSSAAKVSIYLFD